MEVAEISLAEPHMWRLANRTEKKRKVLKGNREKKKEMHRSGVEPEPIAWKAIILPLDHRSCGFLLLLIIYTMDRFESGLVRFFFFDPR